MLYIYIDLTAIFMFTRDFHPLSWPIRKSTKRGFQVGLAKRWTNGIRKSLTPWFPWIRMNVRVAVVESHNVGHLALKYASLCHISEGELVLGFNDV